MDRKPAPLRQPHIYGTRAYKTVHGVTDFLRGNERLASLLPTATRLASLQQDCVAVLPAAFSSSHVISLRDGALVVGVPSSAAAAKLKQQVSQIRDGLARRGWAVESVKFKVSKSRIGLAAPAKPEGKMVLSPAAVEAFEDLGKRLAGAPGTSGIVAAIERLAAKRKAAKS